MVLFAAGVIGAALVHAAPESPRVAHLSVDDGLSQSSVQQILQDRKGLLWFGTQEGLNRYDGYRFTVHRARNQRGFLGDHDITALIEDAGGDLWVGTSRGLYRLDLETGRFDSTEPPVDKLGILDLVQGGDGRIFFIASDGQLWVLDPAASGGRPRPLNDGPFAALTGITALARGSGSAVWAAAGGRLFRVDVAAADPAGRLREALRDLGPVSVMAADQRGGVWIGRPDADLLRYRPADGRVDRFPQAPRNTLAVLPGRGGEIWIGARAGGLTRLDPATGALAVYRHDPEDPASLSGDNVASIYEDEVGSIWVGVWNGGVNRFDPHAQAFRTFRHRPRAPDSLPADDVVAMAESPDGRVWLASRSGLVATGDPRSGRFRPAAELPGRGRLSALEWWDARVLLGTSRGLVLLDPASGRETPLDGPLQAHMLGSRPIAALRTGTGMTWIGAGKDLLRLSRDPGRAARVERFELPIAGSVFTLSTVAPGRLWIGTDAGHVLRAEWSDAAAAVTIRPLDLAGDAVRDALAAHGVIAGLHEDRHGRLWVATRRGLGRIDLGSGTVSWLGEREGLPSTNIAGIAGDADGRLWLGHNRGLTRLDPASGTMTHFGEHDGAQGQGYAEGAWAAGASGLIYFAGDGVTVFNPRAVAVSAARPRIVFTALSILHRPVAPRWLDPTSPLERTIDAQEEVILGPRATALSVEMAPLHFVDPASNRLTYRLEGFDPEWIEGDAHNRIATYTNLAPGRYVLRARGGTRNGEWSEHEATLAIRILPPWWRTRLAIAGWGVLAVAAAGLVWSAARRRAHVRLALLERETLRRESLTDPLTGLHNRRFLVSHLQHEVPKLLRDYRVKGPVAGAGGDLLFLLIDVDHFKSINDRHAHSVGDRVLSRIATVLREHIRDSDLAVRWGGDEFLVVTRSFQRTCAADAAERLRAAVAALGATFAAEGGPACTLSIGFAAFPFLIHQADALTWEQTLDLADHALRVTKNRRRNSYTGVNAGAGLTAATVLEFLASGGRGRLPDGIEILLPAESPPAGPPSAFPA